LITAFTVPYVRNLGLYFKLLDKPDDRKQHRKKTVRIGGISIACGFFIPIIYKYFTNPDYFLDNQMILAFLIGGAGMFFLGLTDDIYNISPFTRLFGQILISIFTWHFGYRIDSINLSNFFTSIGIIQLPDFVSVLITVFLLVAITNAINWLDGLDGLAAGISGICSIGLSIFALNISQSNEVLLMACLSGSCLGFLFYNFYPAKIFMGDSGAYLLGFVIGIFTISTYNQVFELDIYKISLLPLVLILFVPIGDMTYVIFSRLSEGKSPFPSDRRHLQHRLLRSGLSHKSTIILCYLLTSFFVGLSLLTYLDEYRIIIFLVSIIPLIIFIFNNYRITFSSRFKLILTKKNNN
tara:strand:+ start:306 stop:1361 length:1056 start_codon:yes stop_codon:yes gene_type:complete